LLSVDVAVDPRLGPSIRPPRKGSGRRRRPGRWMHSITGIRAWPGRQTATMQRMRTALRPMD